MPGGLQAFANHQPVTFVVNTMRALALGGPIEANFLKSVAWLAGIFIVFAPLAVRATGAPPDGTIRLPGFAPLAVRAYERAA